MRLFIAVSFTPEMKDALRSVQEQLKKQGIRGNYTAAENLHLTLAFIGEQDDPDRVLEVMSGLSFRPFELKLRGLGSFGRLWWAGLSADSELTRSTAALRHLLSEADIPFDRKKFRPHITLIREPDKDRLPEVTIPRAAMTVDRISLMRSDRGKRGMIYTELGSITAEKMNSE